MLGFGELAPLEGKYYGTYVVWPDGRTVRVWNHYVNTVSTDPAPRPSARQLQRWGMDEATARAEGMISDSHYETQADFDFATLIARQVAVPTQGADRG